MLLLMLMPMMMMFSIVGKDKPIAAIGGIKEHLALLLSSAIWSH
ncbi:hypothetical protein ACKWRH_27780 [Bradyrhizobium sp. Pa8]